jgi:hypothetical protein
MMEISLYEVGDEVFVKAVVTAVTIDQGEIKYQIKNEITGRNYEHLFVNEQLFPSTAEEETQS